MVLRSRILFRSLCSDVTSSMLQSETQNLGRAGPVSDVLDALCQNCKDAKGSPPVSSVERALKDLARLFDERRSSSTTEETLVKAVSAVSVAFNADKGFRDEFRRREEALRSLNRLTRLLFASFPLPQWSSHSLSQIATAVGGPYSHQLFAQNRDGIDCLLHKFSQDLDNLSRRDLVSLVRALARWQPSKANPVRRRLERLGFQDLQRRRIASGGDLGTLLSASARLDLRSDSSLVRALCDLSLAHAHSFRASEVAEVVSSLSRLRSLENNEELFGSLMRQAVQQVGSMSERDSATLALTCVNVVKGGVVDGRGGRRRRRNVAVCDFFDRLSLRIPEGPGKGGVEGEIETTGSRKGAEREREGLLNLYGRGRDVCLLVRAFATERPKTVSRHPLPSLLACALSFIHLLRPWELSGMVRVIGETAPMAGVPEAVKLLTAAAERCASDPVGFGRTDTSRVLWAVAVSLPRIDHSRDDDVGVRRVHQLSDRLLSSVSGCAKELFDQKRERPPGGGTAGVGGGTETDTPSADIGRMCWAAARLDQFLHGSSRGDLSPLSGGEFDNALESTCSFGGGNEVSPLSRDLNADAQSCGDERRLRGLLKAGGDVLTILLQQGECTSEDVSRVVWALGETGIVHAEFLQASAKMVVERGEKFSDEQLAAVSRGFVLCGHLDPLLFETLVRETVQRAHSLQARTLPSLYWSCARSGFGGDVLFEAVSSEVLKRCEEWCREGRSKMIMGDGDGRDDDRPSGQTITNLCWATVASSTATRQDESARRKRSVEVMEALARVVCRHLPVGGEGWIAPAEAAAVMGAFARQRHRDAELFRVCASFIASRSLGKNDKEAVALALWAIGQVGLCDCQLGGNARLLNQAGIDLLSVMSARQVGMVCWGAAVSSCVVCRQCCENSESLDLLRSLLGCALEEMERRFSQFESVKGASSSVWHALHVLEIARGGKERGGPVGALSEKGKLPGSVLQKVRRVAVREQESEAVHSSGAQSQTRNILRSLGLKFRQEVLLKNDVGFPPVDFLVDLGGGKGEVVVEVDGPKHFLSNFVEEPTGSTLLRDFLLKGRGWRVVRVTQDHLNRPESWKTGQFFDLSVVFPEVRNRERGTHFSEHAAQKLSVKSLP